MSVQYTEEQKNAIGARGQVIVSASAGSGKTFVMIERLVSLIVEEGVDVSEILAVTFTNKAAAQMREKLRKALLEKISQTAGERRARLKEQLNALPLADISTIHAFCGRLIRSNFFLVDTDAAFRIVSPDDAEGKELCLRAMDEVFENAYEEGGEEFRRLLSVYFRQKKDTRLRSVVSGIYANCRGFADYRETLGRAGKDDRFEEVCAYLAEDFRERARYFADEAEEQAVFFAESGSRAMKVCYDVVNAAQALIDGGDLFGIVSAAAETPRIAPMPPSTRAEGEELLRLKRTSALSAGIKELYKEIRKIGPCEEEYARYLDGQSRAAALCSLVLRYDEAYTRLKKEAGALDYNDLEHLAIEILQNDGARAVVREKYHYVFVDEFQDVNPAQETILSLIGGKDVFLVGDLKQSIYGFRGSKSEYFANKLDLFSKEENAHALRLTENFRSASGVLEAVNRVFSRAMTAETCGFSYAEECVMRGGRRYGEHAGGVRFHRVAKEKAEKQPPKGVYSVLQAEAGVKAADAQAEEIARIIRSEVGKEWYDADDGIVRRVGYGDIAVLVRKTTGDAERVVAALSAADIPVTSVSAVNVCDYWEVRLLIDWLSFLDNAEQDIPRAGAMLSSVGRFTDGDLARIRLRFPSCFTFRSACAEYGKKMADGLSSRLKDFESRVADYRAQCSVRTAAEMIDRLLSDGLETEIASKKDGVRRLSRVRRFTAEAQGSVHEFLRRLTRTGFRVEYSESGGENAVKVLTMHKSKGLEYPVVILASLDAPFHGAERDEVMWTENFLRGGGGFLLAPKSFDGERRLVYETLLRRASAAAQEREEVRQELNLLYVAMTRAQYRLHMVFGEGGGAFSPRYAKRFSDFVDLSDCADYFAEEEETEEVSQGKDAIAGIADEATVEKILSVYGEDYIHSNSVDLPVKSSATELMKAEGEKVKIFRGSASESADPQTGLAYHAFLQHVDFSKTAGEELDRMAKEGVLTEEQISLLERDKLEKILSIPCLKSLAGKRLSREQTFLVSLPANQLPPYKGGDEIVFQGAIDLIAEDGDGILLIDYKFSSHDDGRIRSDYAVQIMLYKKAIAKVRRVDERTIRARIVNILACREIEM